MARLRLLMVALVVVLAGCAATPSMVVLPPEAGATASPSGTPVPTAGANGRTCSTTVATIFGCREYVSVSGVENGTALAWLPQYPIALFIDSHNGRDAISATDCSTVSAPVVIMPTVLRPVASEIVETAIGCFTDAGRGDALIAGMLAGDISFQVSGDHLTLVSRTVQLEFRTRIPTPVAAGSTTGPGGLRCSSTVASLMGCRVFFATAGTSADGPLPWIATHPVRLQISNGGGMDTVVATVCNTINQPVIVTSVRLLPNGPAPSSLVGCPAEQAAADFFIAAFFKEAVTYTVNGDALTLTGRTGTLAFQPE